MITFEHSRAMAQELHEMIGAAREIAAVLVSDMETAFNESHSVSVVRGPLGLVTLTAGQFQIARIHERQASRLALDLCDIETIEAIQELLSYNWRDEQRDYEACQQDGNDPSGHIFTKMQLIDNWLNSQKGE